MKLHELGCEERSARLRERSHDMVMSRCRGRRKYKETHLLQQRLNNGILLTNLSKEILSLTRFSQNHQIESRFIIRRLRFSGHGVSMMMVSGTIV